MSGGIAELVAQAESSPALIEAQANVARLQAKVREAKEALGGASRGIQIAKHAVAGTLVDGGTADVLSLEDAVEKEKTARLLFEATQEALSDAWSRLREAKREARRDVVPELARRHAEAIEELATLIERARDIVLLMRSNSSVAASLLEFDDRNRQQLIREFKPAWLKVLFHDGRYEVDNAAAFRKNATNEIEVMFEGLGVKRRGKSAKMKAKPAKSGRLDFLKKVFVP